MNIIQKIVDSIDKRSHLKLDINTNCYRLFNSGGDGFEGLTIDFYGEFLLIQFFNKEAEEFCTGKRFVSDIEKIIQASEIDVKGVLLKNRKSMKGNLDFNAIRRSRLLLGEEPEKNFFVKQNGILMSVDLINGQSTGVFLDMREVRNRLSLYFNDESPGKILNLFSYTSAFSIHALKNGVNSAINVDLSKAVLKRAKQNYELNGLRVDERDFIYGDALYWVKRFEKQGSKFSFAVLDPPTFSRSKQASFSVKRDYSQLLENLGKIVKNGAILSSINSYSVSKDEYISFHPKGWEMVIFMNESDDFPSEREPYLKAGLWKCR